MKTTLQAAVLAVVGMVLAMPVWGHDWPEAFEDNAVTDPRSTFTATVTYPYSESVGRRAVKITWSESAFRELGFAHFQIERTGYSDFNYSRPGAPTGTIQIYGAGYIESSGKRFESNVDYFIYLRPHLTFSGQRPSNYYRWSRHVHFRTPNLESKPDPETPEPEDPTDPEPEPETPDHSHPVQRCDHLAIVPALPGALAGDEDAPDHWLHVANPGAAGITFTVTGRDMAGAKGGMYRRELPAYRSVKVKMRDIEAAFDVAEPEGWWTLTVTGSGPLYVAATMRQGDARRFVPVERPATCGTGAVTRTGTATRPAGDVSG